MLLQEAELRLLRLLPRECGAVGLEIPVLAAGLTPWRPRLAVNMASMLITPRFDPSLSSCCLLCLHILSWETGVDAPQMHCATDKGRTAGEVPLSRLGPLHGVPSRQN